MNFTFFLKQQLNTKSKKKIKKKLSLRAKDIYKKKIYFKKFLINFYHLRKVSQLKSIALKSQRLQGNKVINFFFALERQLAIVCVRTHLF